MHYYAIGMNMCHARVGNLFKNRSLPTEEEKDDYLLIVLRQCHDIKK